MVVDLRKFDIENVYRLVSKISQQPRKRARELVVDQEPHDILMSA